MSLYKVKNVPLNSSRVELTTNGWENRIRPFHSASVNLSNSEPVIGDPIVTSGLRTNKSAEDHGIPITLIFAPIQARISTAAWKGRLSFWTTAAILSVVGMP